MKRVTLSSVRLPSPRRGRRARRPRRAASHRGRRRQVRRRGREAPPRPHRRGEPRRLGAGELHHAGHGGPLGPRGRAPHQGHGRARQGGRALPRRRGSARDRRASSRRSASRSTSRRRPTRRRARELTRLATGPGRRLRARAARSCPGAKDGLTFEEVNRRMATSRDPKELLALWKAWHAVGTPMRADYARFVALANEGAKELGFADTGAMWRSKYDMPPDAFAKELDRLWERGQAALRRAPHLRAHEAPREVRRRRPGERPDPGAPPREHVGAGLDERLPAPRAEERGHGLRPHEDPRDAARSTRGGW